jgi:hypothetical protein
MSGPKHRQKIKKCFVYTALTIHSPVGNFAGCGEMGAVLELEKQVCYEPKRVSLVAICNEAGGE